MPCRFLLAALLATLAPITNAQLPYEMIGFSQCEPIAPAELGAAILAAGADSRLQLAAPRAFRAGLHCALDTSPDERGRAIYHYSFRVAVVEQKTIEGRLFEATLGEAVLWGGHTAEGIRQALPGAVKAAIGDYRQHHPEL